MLGYSMKTLLTILLFPLLLIAKEEPLDQFESYLIHEGKGDKFSLGYGVKWKGVQWNGDVGIKIITWTKIDGDLTLDKACLEIGISL